MCAGAGTSVFTRLSVELSNQDELDAALFPDACS